MAVNNSVLFYRDNAPTSNSTLYTVAPGVTATITNIAVTNTSSSSQTFTIKLGGIELVSGATIAAKTVGLFDIRQVLQPSDAIEGFASADTVNFHINGSLSY